MLNNLKSRLAGKKYRTISTVVLSILLAGVTLAQETTVKLPTTDNTSSFNVTKSNGTKILQVKGDGTIVGDGSNLTCVVKSESDPTVPANIKDGVSWTEISNRPAGLDDGDDGLTSESDPQVGSNTTNYVSKWNGSALVKGTIINNGKVGINESSPSAQLHVGGTNGLIVGGTIGSGSTLNLGGGARMHWYPKKAAFRAGWVYSDQWDDANIGNGSVAFGYSSIASGNRSIAMGSSAEATGDHSTAIGLRCEANKDGSCVIGDRSSTTVMEAKYDNIIKTRFAGGYTFYTNSTLSSGVYLSPGGSSWLIVSDSTKKENFVNADGEYFLESISELKLGSWNYKVQERERRHYGPMAQEIYHYFGKDQYGTIGNDSTLAMADMDGIMMIALQALENRTKELSEKYSEV